MSPLCSTDIIRVERKHACERYFLFFFFSLDVTLIYRVQQHPVYYDIYLE